MVSPPDAEPVSAGRIFVATASETSGPPSMPRTHALHGFEGRQRRHHRAEADQALPR